MRLRPILVVLAAMLSGCAQLTGDLAPPEVSVANIGFGSPGLFEQELRVDLRLRNPNDFAVAVDAVRFDLDLNDIRFASGRTDENFELPALDDVVVPVAIAVPTNDLIDRVTQLATGEPISYRLTGVAELGALFGVPIPFQRVGRLELPRLPGLTTPGS